jgi:GAF domain-containing protein
LPRLRQTPPHTSRAVGEGGDLRRQLDEALEQQRATREVLGAIGAADPDLELIFRTIVENAVRLCHAANASVMVAEGEGYRQVAHHPVAELEGYARLVKDSLTKPGRGSVSGRVLLEGRTVQVEDVFADPDYDAAMRRRMIEDESREEGQAVVHTILGVPIKKADQVLGVILVRRREVRAFDGREVAILETFADQAAIALENARLFREMKEALARQTATSEVLGLISRSGTDLTPVFQAIVERAARLCEATTATIMRREGDAYIAAADAVVADLSPEERASWETWLSMRAARGGLTKLDRGTVAGRALLERRTVQIQDVRTDPEYDQGQRPPGAPDLTMIGVPLLHDGDPVGVIVLRRMRTSPFTPAQIALVETFADQAVIAIQNAQSRETVERQRGELRRFLSPQIADLITSPEGQALLSGHRREITVAFCDLRGFTAFSETADPEEALAVVRSYHATLGPLIIEYGGTLEHFEGDGAMVFFNDPVPVADHALRAVKMTLAMRERMAEHVARWRKTGTTLPSAAASRPATRRSDGSASRAATTTARSAP